MSEPEVRRVFASDGERVRRLRLEALDDPAAGIAFLETRDDAMARPREFWDERAVGAALSGSAAQFIAETGRTWVGTVTILIPEPGVADYFGRVRDTGGATAVAVYVNPEHRGTGLLDRLFAAGAAWARTQGADSLFLDVHDENTRARAAYARLGFRPTGATIEGPNGLEHELSRSLDDD
ncbi:GNAT family N-acetyltransferase [Microbacterium sp. SS28]|uniref:GNAT family N-acetyltransferase n=1 Tax=Microbacterium sp. SS28 TaxID=2919948 RepID=UPI001FAA1CF6|nr:GNAT family N-acetyltransferase [Microbacterium sp. SS28]